MTRVMMIASNVGLWAEELQAPWDALRKAGLKRLFFRDAGMPVQD